jgi:hypothetical protein
VGTLYTLESLFHKPISICRKLGNLHMTQHDEQETGAISLGCSRRQEIKSTRTSMLRPEFSD